MSSLSTWDELLSHTKPLGKGVTSVVYPTQDTRWVIKFAQVHRPDSCPTLATSRGYDGLKDGHINAHCATLERHVSWILSSTNYVHVPRMLHTTHVEFADFSMGHIYDIPDTFLAGAHEGAVIQATV